MTRRAVWFIEACFILLLSLPLALMPLSFAQKVGEKLGLLLFFIWKSRREVAIRNLSHLIENGALRVSEPAEKIIRDNFQNLGQSFAEVLKIYFGLGRSIIDSVTIEGIEHFQEARAKGRGILLITGHCGNWELLAITASVKVTPIAIVARRINNPYINRLVEKVRKRYGNKVIYKQGALKPIMQETKNNGCVGILMDQAVVPEEGYIINFLGRGAWTTKMPALIAKKTGAAVLPVFMHRTKTGHAIGVYPAVELSSNSDREQALIEDTQRFSSFIEAYIREHPEEWLWMHRRWKRVPGP
ncbi:MAG: lysophospholipid acyltransferase family protein [Thermodesulfovibrionales bacterium]|nr:lysophospholipid acyltransferase family protein [Thermodesulfovibrionales bacterium]